MSRCATQPPIAHVRTIVQRSSVRQSRSTVAGATWLRDTPMCVKAVTGGHRQGGSDCLSQACAAVVAKAMQLLPGLLQPRTGRVRWCGRRGSSWFYGAVARSPAHLMNERSPRAGIDAGLGQRCATTPLVDSGNPFFVVVDTAKSTERGRESLK